MDGLLNLSNMPFASVLNRNVAGPGSLRLIVVGLICNNNILYSIFIVLFTNLMYASVYPLLWWLYDDDSACQMLSPFAVLILF